MLDENEDGARFRQPLHLETAIAELASRQHGVATVRQLTALGLGPRGVQERAEIGRFRRLYRGVYALGPAELTDDGRWMAATLACRRAALHHTSAARAWGFLDVSEAPVHVAVPTQGRNRKGLIVHGGLRADDVTTLRGIRIATVAATVTALADHPRIERMVNEAQILGILDIVALRERAARRPALLALVDDVSAGVSRSDLEDLFWGHWRGTSRALRNHVLDLGHRRITVDVWFPDERVVVELDGARYHRTTQAFERDRERDTALAALDILAVRLTWRRLTRDRARALDELERTLAARRGPYPKKTAASS